MEKDKVRKLIDLSRVLLECPNLGRAIAVAIQKIKEIIEVERVSLFIYSQSANMVWTYLADGVEKLILPSDKGIVGYVVKNKTIKKVNDTSKEPLFYKDVDNMTGYETKNILAVPLLDNSDNRNRLIGVIELINKRDKFTQKDINFSYLFSNYLTPPLLDLLSQHKSLKVDNNDDYFI